jgi:transposase
MGVQTTQADHRMMPSMVRIALTNATRKMPGQRLQQAYGDGVSRLVRRIHALLELAEGASVAEVATLLGVGEQTVRDWLHAFVHRGQASLTYRCPPGGPPKLSRCQRQELLGWILAGPEAAGYPTACWTAVLIADLIWDQFQVRYHPRYVPQLLDHLGLSYQKAKFGAAGADDEAALAWLEQTWPEIVRMAQDKWALLLFGDEASFAQWGTLGYTWAVKGCQPVAKTSGIRKAYRVFGALDCFGGRYYSRGLAEEKFDSTTYQAFLEWLLTQVTDPIVLIQDNAPRSLDGLSVATVFARPQPNRRVVEEDQERGNALAPFLPLCRLGRESHGDAPTLRWLTRRTDCRRRRVSLSSTSCRLTPRLFIRVPIGGKIALPYTIEFP